MLNNEALRHYFNTTLPEFLLLKTTTTYQTKRKLNKILYVTDINKHHPSVPLRLNVCHSLL